MVAVIRCLSPRFTAGVVGVILNDIGEILLVEHAFHPQYPWGLPGGWMDRKESPAATLEREIQEEMGMTITVLRPLKIDFGVYRNHLDIAFLYKANCDVQALSTELLGYRWAQAG